MFSYKCLFNPSSARDKWRMEEIEDRGTKKAVKWGYKERMVTRGRNVSEKKKKKLIKDWEAQHWSCGGCCPTGQARKGSLLLCQWKSMSVHPRFIALPGWSTHL